MGKRDIIDVRGFSRQFVAGYVVVMVALVAAFGVAACVPQGPTDPGDITIVNTNTNNTNTGGTSNPQASPSPGTCGPVVEVTNGILGTGGVKNASLKVGQSQTLDTTPNKNADEHCNAFRPVSWAVTQSVEVCRLNNRESYTPVVTAVTAGTCVIRATIGGVSASEPITITVTN
jgi:hypothetical protein